MPPSLENHSDAIWFLMILLGIGFLGVLSWTATGKLNDLQSGQDGLKQELSDSVKRIHRRIDGTDRTVNQLVGAHNALHPASGPAVCHSQAEPEDGV